MNILMDIGHPAHVHLLRNLYFELKKKGHRLFVTVKDIKVARELLDFYGIPYLVVGKKGTGLIGKATSQVAFNYKIWKLIRKQRIQMGIGTSVTLAQLSRVTGMKSIILDDDDDEVQPLFVKFAHPYCDSLLSPDVLKGKRKRQDTLYYPGYHELAYLHPNRFSPDPDVLKEAGLAPGQRYFILRFNEFRAHHDTGSDGLSGNQRDRLVKFLEPYGKVFISTEKDVHRLYQSFRAPVTPERIHSLLAYSTLFIGDSQTMTSEAAVLGVPAVRCNTFVGRISYLEEEEKKYGLTFGFLPANFDHMLDKIKELLDMPDLKSEWQRRRMSMLTDKIDVTTFLTWFIENYPESVSIMKNNPDHLTNSTNLHLLD